MDREPGHLTHPYTEEDLRLKWVKLVAVGSMNVGKTCLVKHFCESKFNNSYQATVGVDYGFKVHEVKDSADLYVHLWDLSGSPDYLDIRNELYADTDGIFLTFSVTDRRSFQELNEWMNETKRYLNSKPAYVLVANKVDEEAARLVSTGEGRAWAKQHGCCYHETSCLHGSGIDSMFHDLLTQAASKQPKNQR